jgi:hypothetical protein
MGTPDEGRGSGESQAERGGAASAGSSGAPPSNRAPDSCNPDGYSLLSRHVDTLDLSYRGRLHSHVERELANLKHLAQSREDAYQALAQFVLGEHVFSVHDKGYRLFPYVLHNDLFRVTLAGASANALPMAVCQVRNYALITMGPERCEQELRKVLSQLGELAAESVVGRSDLAVDFMTTDDLEAWGHDAWVTRIRAKRKHADGDRFSGWDIGGHGDPASFGLYDKTLEIGPHGTKAYMHEIWERAGRVPWDGPVWRAEARLRREYFRRFGLRTLPEVLRAIPALWKEFTTETLRLAVPVPSDKTRSRWPDHPLWIFLRSVDWGTPFEPIGRTARKISAPGNPYFGRGQGGLITSLMARDGITDPKVAHERLWFMAQDYYAWAHPSPAEVFLERARIKQRRYGVRVTDGPPVPPSPEDPAARAYRKASKG